jgi:hypothetical protein
MSLKEHVDLEQRTKKLGSNGQWLAAVVTADKDEGKKETKPCGEVLLVCSFLTRLPFSEHHITNDTSTMVQKIGMV